MRKIALDIGTKTIGIAVSDELQITARGVKTLERVGIRKDAGKVIDLVKEYNCDTVVIGLPKNLDGTDSQHTNNVYDFRKMLENKLRSSGMNNIEITYQDERFTTVIATDVLIEAGVRREKRKQIIDKQAAVIILQSYLDSQAKYKGR